MFSVSELSGDTLKTKQLWINVSHKMIEHYQQECSVEGIGKCIDIWRTRKDVKESEMISALGFLLGDLIIQQHGGQWVMVEDQWGATPAIRKTEQGMVTYAIDSVSKRLRDDSCSAARELPSVAKTYSRES